MSPWSRELTQMAGAAVATLGVALTVLAYLGPLVATGAALTLLGLIAVVVGYVGLQGPLPRLPASLTDAEIAVLDQEAVLARTRKPDTGTSEAW